MYSDLSSWYSSSSTYSLPFLMIVIGSLLYRLVEVQVAHPAFVSVLLYGLYERRSLRDALDASTKVIMGDEASYRPTSLWLAHGRSPSDIIPLTGILDTVISHFILCLMIVSKDVKDVI